MNAGEASPLLTSAATVNAVLEAARQSRSQARGRAGGDDFSDFFRACTLARIQYTGDSSVSLPQFSVLAYGDSVINPDDASLRNNASRSPVFKGSVPTSPTAPFVITIEPIEGQRICRAVVSGLAVVQVNVTDITHRQARPIAGTTANLGSVAANGVPITWPQSFSATGLQWCEVLMEMGSVAGCCPSPPAPVTIPMGGCSSGSGGGSGSGGAVPTCLFGINGCEAFLSDPPIWTPAGNGLLMVPQQFNFGCGQVLGTDPMLYPQKLTGAAKAAAIAACGGKATFWIFSCSGSTALSCFGGSSQLGPSQIVTKYPQTMCIVLFNGTRSYSDLSTPMTLGSTFDGFGFPINTTIGRVTLAGRLVFCGTASIPGWYYDGVISSTASDPSNPGVYTCGCVANIVGCPPAAAGGNQQIIVGPNFATPSETLQITTGCGVVSISLGPCTSVPPPPPPPPPPPSGYNCIGGVCTPSTSGAGTYATFGLCAASPPCTPTPPPPPGCCPTTLPASKPVNLSFQGSAPWVIGSRGSTSAHADYATWTPFAAYPASANGASIVCDDSGNFELWLWGSGTVGIEPPAHAFAATSTTCYDGISQGNINFNGGATSNWTVP